MKTKYVRPLPPVDGEIRMCEDSGMKHNTIKRKASELSKVPTMSMAKSLAPRVIPKGIEFEEGYRQQCPKCKGKAEVTPYKKCSTERKNRAWWRHPHLTVFIKCGGGCGEYWRTTQAWREVQWF